MKPVLFYFLRDGKPMAQITTQDADGFVALTETFAVSSKAEAIAIAKRDGARFTA